MSQSRTMLLAILGGGVLFYIIGGLLDSHVAGGIAFGAWAILSVVIVWVSPYPDSTHHFGGGVPRQQWGFTSEQDGDKWIIEPANTDGENQ